MDYKTETKKAYDSYPEKFDEYFGFYFDQYVQKEADNFLSKLKGKTILDLGSGTGNHAEYFQKKGFDVTCLDISEEMLKVCKNKGLKTVLMDIENLGLKEKFDGIWSYTSFLHLQKRKLEYVVPKIASVMKPHSLFFLSLIEGNGEKYEANERFPGVNRWFSYFTNEEIKKLFSTNFDLVYESKTSYFSTKTNEVKYVFLNYIFKLKVI